MPKQLSIPIKKPPLGDFRRVLAYNIRLLRLEKGWSQEDSALECDLDRTYVSAVERAVWNVSLSNLAKFAQALQTEAWKLLRIE